LRKSIIRNLQSVIINRLLFGIFVSVMAKFLILRFSSIGDIILTSPVIRCIKQQVKDAEVHYATKRSFSAVIEHNPYIDKRFFLDEDMETDNQGLSEFISDIKKEKYDFIIDLHHNLRTYIIKRKLGVKSFSFNKINFEKWLMVNFKINRLPKRHIVDRYMETVRTFGVTNDGNGLDYFISTEDEKALEKIPGTFRNGYIGFAIGARHVTKKLPVKKIISICSKINQPIILLGGKEDFDAGEIIVRESKILNFESHVVNACGKFSLNESAALVKHASKIITHDTGLMHIAAAYKKEIISVWGNTIPEFGMSPYYGNGQIRNLKSEIRNLSCRPCTKLGFEKCPKGHFKCMKEIDENEIVEKLS
jgi:ADP-heptose:LPS heptosyltransferase